MVFPILIEALETNLKSHWSKNVQDLTQNVKVLLEELEPILYKTCFERIEIRELEVRLEEDTRRKRWERIKMVARANNLLY